jgi:hypothetical protein
MAGMKPDSSQSRSAILSARDAASVHKAVNDYAQSIAPGDFESLPAPVRQALTQPIDIRGAAVTLLNSELGRVGDSDLGEILRDTANVLSIASMKLGQIERSLLGLVRVDA